MTCRDCVYYHKVTFEGEHLGGNIFSRYEHKMCLKDPKLFDGLTRPNYDAHGDPKLIACSQFLPKNTEQSTDGDTLGGEGTESNKGEV